MSQPDAIPPTPAAPPRAARARRASRAPYGLVLVGLALAVVAAWVLRGRIEPVVAGVPAPTFQVAALDGGPVTLDTYRDKVVLLNVWATWCAPCLEEMP